MQENVCQWLVDWFSSRGKVQVPAPQTLRDVNYFDAGMLTSMEVVEFVTEIEEKFGIQFSEPDLLDQRFLTISGLAELISERAMQASDGY